MDLQQRLAKLERSNQNLRLAVCILGGFLVIGFFLPNANPLNANYVQTRTIEAQSFVVRDQRGSARCILQMVDGGGGLFLYGADDTTTFPRLGLSVTKSGPTIGMFDDKAKIRVSISVDDKGEPAFSLYDSSSKLLANITVPQAGGTIRLSNSEGESMVLPPSRRPNQSAQPENATNENAPPVSNNETDSDS